VKRDVKMDCIQVWTSGLLFSTRQSVCGFR